MRTTLKKSFLRDLQQLMRFPSVMSKSLGDYPYGQSIGEALQWFYN
jgi:hypothetical protein